MKRDYRQFVAAAAQFMHYPHPEREQRWLARLGFNQGEISIPRGASRGGKPIGPQLMAAPGQDCKLLAIAARVEALLGAG
jgi:hypothetical protein